MIQQLSITQQLSTVDRGCASRFGPPVRSAWIGPGTGCPVTKRSARVSHGSRAIGIGGHHVDDTGVDALIPCSTEYPGRRLPTGAHDRTAPAQCTESMYSGLMAATTSVLGFSAVTKR